MLQVEDRRLEAEKELISAKVQSERALKQLELTKQQHQKLKVSQQKTCIHILYIWLKQNWKFEAFLWILILLIFWRV